MKNDKIEINKQNNIKLKMLDYIRKSCPENKFDFETIPKQLREDLDIWVALRVEMEFNAALNFLADLAPSNILKAFQQPSNSLLEKYDQYLLETRGLLGLDKINNSKNLSKEILLKFANQVNYRFLKNNIEKIPKEYMSEAFWQKVMSNHAECFQLIPNEQKSEKLCYLALSANFECASIHVPNDMLKKIGVDFFHLGDLLAIIPAKAFTEEKIREILTNRPYSLEKLLLYNQYNKGSFTKNIVKIVNELGPEKLLSANYSQTLYKQIILMLGESVKNILDNYIMNAYHGCVIDMEETDVEEILDAYRVYSTKPNRLKNGKFVLVTDKNNLIAFIDQQNKLGKLDNAKKITKIILIGHARDSVQHLQYSFAGCSNYDIKSLINNCASLEKLVLLGCHTASASSLPIEDKAREQFFNKFKKTQEGVFLKAVSECKDFDIILTCDFPNAISENKALQKKIEKNDQIAHLVINKKANDFDLYYYSPGAKSASAFMSGIKNENLNKMKNFLNKNKLFFSKKTGVWNTAFRSVHNKSLKAVDVVLSLGKSDNQLQITSDNKTKNIFRSSVVITSKEIDLLDPLSWLKNLYEFLKDEISKGNINDNINIELKGYTGHLMVDTKKNKMIVTSCGPFYKDKKYQQSFFKSSKDNIDRKALEKHKREYMDDLKKQDEIYNSNVKSIKIRLKK